MTGNPTKTIAILGLLSILLVACQSSQERLEEMAEGLPLPAETVLIASQIEPGGGSQDTCIFLHLNQLYASDLSFEEIRGFYGTQLQNDGWTQISLSWLSEDYPLFRIDDEYQLAIGR
jgi:hypothetical protein